MNKTWLRIDLFGFYYLIINDPLLSHNLIKSSLEQLTITTFDR